MTKNIVKYYPLVLIAAVIVLGILFFQSQATLKQERLDREYQVKQDDKNFAALKDSLNVDYNKKLDAWEYTKDNFVVQELADLEKYNKELFDDLEKVKGELVAALEAQGEADLSGGVTVGDSIVKLSVQDVNNNTQHYGIGFKTDYADSSFTQTLEGMSKFYVDSDPITNMWNIRPHETVYTKNLTTLNITYGFKEYKNRYQVFALSKSPKFKIIDLNGGYFIDKQPSPPPERVKRWGFGPYLGYGVVSNLDAASFGISFGVGIHYDLFKW